MSAKIMQKCSPFENLICEPLDKGKWQATSFSLLHFAPLSSHHVLVEKIEQIGTEELKHEYDMHLARIRQARVFEMVE